MRRKQQKFLLRNFKTLPLIRVRRLGIEPGPTVWQANAPQLTTTVFSHLDQSHNNKYICLNRHLHRLITFRKARIPNNPSQSNVKGISRLKQSIPCGSDFIM